MQFSSRQLEAAHQFGEAILRFMQSIDSRLVEQATDTYSPDSKPAAIDLGENRLLRATDVAQMLSLSRATVYQLMYSGRLPSVQIGTARRFKLSEVKKLIENGAPAT